MKPNPYQFFSSNLKNLPTPFIMRWLGSLPSVKPELKNHLPDCPGLYFFMVGSSTYYVGKALSIKQRHSSEGNHDVYRHLNQTRPSLRKLFRIKWMSFSSIEVPGYSLDTLLLGYEDYMIKVLCPRWNKQKNGVELTDTVLHSITSKLMSESLSESLETSIVSEFPCSTSPSEIHESPNLTCDRDLLERAKKHAKLKRDNGKIFNQADWNMKDYGRVQELVAIINSFSRGENNPDELIRLGLTLLVQRVSNGMLVDVDEDLSLLDEKFHPETFRHPELLEISKEFLRLYPQMAFDDLVLRCMGCSADALCPIDWAALKRIYSVHHHTQIESEPEEGRENQITNTSSNI